MISSSDTFRATTTSFGNSWRPRSRPPSPPPARSRTGCCRCVFRRMPTTPPAAEPRIQYSSLRQGPGDYSTHYSGLRGVRHRRIGALLRDCAAQEGGCRGLPPPRPAAIDPQARASLPVCPRGRSRAGRAACRPCGPACTVVFPPMTRRHPGMYSDMYPHAHPGRRAATPGLPERPTAPLPARGCAWPRSCRLDAARAQRAGAPSS